MNRTLASLTFVTFVVIVVLASGCASSDDEFDTSKAFIAYADARIGCTLSASQQSISRAEFGLPRPLVTELQFRWSDNPELPGSDWSKALFGMRIYGLADHQWREANRDFSLSDKLDFPNKDLLTPAPGTHKNIVLAGRYDPSRRIFGVLAARERSEGVLQGMPIVRVDITNDNRLTVGIDLDRQQTSAALHAMGAVDFTSPNLPALGRMEVAVGTCYPAPIQRHLPPEDNDGLSFHFMFCCRR